MGKSQFGKRPAKVGLFAKRIRIPKGTAYHKRNMTDALQRQPVYFFCQLRTGDLLALQIQQYHIGMFRYDRQQPPGFFFQNLVPLRVRRFLWHFLFIYADDFQFAKRLQTFHVFVQRGR